MTRISGIREEIASTDRTEGGCFHCGNEFDDVVISAYQHEFCCEGCKTVYEILNENGLSQYYGLESTPGVKVGRVSKNKYAFLDHEEIQEELLSFSDNGVARINLFVKDIHCSSCIWLLENLHRLHSGVIRSQVNFLKKEVDVVFNKNKISLRELVELMLSIGYEPNINLQSAEGQKSNAVDKSGLYKLGVAGFAFGNIMMLSFPDYFDQNNYLDDSFQKLFGYLNLGLAIPVLLYSASDYFVSSYKALKSKFVNIDFPISVGILVLFIRSAYEIVSGIGTGFMDSFTMFVFLLLVGKWYQSKTYKALSFERDYRSYFPMAVLKVSGQKESPVPIKSLQVGDVIRIRSQEIIPTDSELIKGRGEIDYSFVTGESDSVIKEVGAKIFAGGRQLGSSIILKVTKTVSQSYLTRLWNQDAFNEPEKGYQSIVNKVSQYFTLFVLLVSVVTLFFWWGSGVSVALKVFTSVLIIACPCALALTLPFSFGNTMTVFGRNSFYIKNSQVVEKMSHINCVVFDKTGTLTQNGEDVITFQGEELSVYHNQLIKSLVSHSTHPLSKSIFNHLENERTLEVLKFQEISSKGLQGEIDGKQIKVGSSAFIGVSSLVQSPLGSVVHVQVDSQYLGYFYIRKNYRHGLCKLIEDLQEMNIRTYLLSGDNDQERTNLEFLFKKENIYFNQTPEDKLRFISSLNKKADNKVMMVGDGLNDAGALKEAHVGIAVSDDVYSFTPACDAIIDANKLMKLKSFLTFTQSTMNTVKWSFFISILYNTTGMVFAIQGFVTPLFAAILMPLSSITVVSFISLSIGWKAKKFNL